MVQEIIGPISNEVHHSTDIQKVCLKFNTRKQWKRKIPLRFVKIQVVW